jgi:hypothetical protein
MTGPKVGSSAMPTMSSQALGRIIIGWTITPAMRASGRAARARAMIWAAAASTVGRVGFTVAHQYLHQLEPEIRHAVLGNAGTIISFRVGAEDGSRSFASTASTKLLTVMIAGPALGFVANAMILISATLDGRPIHNLPTLVFGITASLLATGYFAFLMSVRIRQKRIAA